MICSQSMTPVKFAAAMMLVAGLCGCTFTGLRQEPKSLPQFSYAAPGASGVLQRIPVSVDLSECVETAMVSEHGSFGGNSFAGTVPLREIMRRELEKMTKNVFRSPVEGEREALAIRITSQKVIINQRRSVAECEMEFYISVEDPVHDDIKPYFRGSFNGRGSGRHRDDRLVPGSVYVAANEVVENFLGSFCEDRIALRRLPELLCAGENLTPPKLQSIRFKEAANGCLAGECSVACNEWDGFDADRWARQNIKAQCQMKLGVEPERTRVVFRKDEYDVATKVWKYHFVAYVRAPLVMDYDPATKSGLCVGDLGLLNLSADEAAKRMKKYVMSEMRSRGGAVTSAEGNDETLVRFDDFRSDVENNRITMRFRLVY